MASAGGPGSCAGRGGGYEKFHTAARPGAALDGVLGTCPKPVLCAGCHGSSRGEGIDEFQQAHGGTRATACAVCHTSAPGTYTAQWPRQFQWKSR